MYSEDHSSTPAQSQADSEPIPMLQRSTVHPDSLKFMDMAKDLLDKPEVQEAIKGEQEKPQDRNY